MRQRSSAAATATTATPEAKEPKAGKPEQEPATPPAVEKASGKPSPAAKADIAEEFLGRNRQDPQLPGEYQAIVTTVFSLEKPDAVYRQLEEAIRPVRASRSDRGTIIDRLDEAQDHARVAHQLLANAKATVDAFTLDAQIVIGGMREQAIAKLTAEKATGARTKQVTEADVEGVAATLYPDEWRAIQDRTGKARRTVAYLEALVDRCVDRARDLRAILNAMAG